jgi:dienelactone hydrolase
VAVPVKTGILALCLVLAALPAAAQTYKPATPRAEDLARCDKVEAAQLRANCRLVYGIPGLVLPSAPEPFDPLGVAHMALYKPAGDGPFPAIVLLPTCGGIGPHLLYWARHALDEGYAVLILDSLFQRGLPTTCTVASPVPTMAIRSRDAYDALAHLATLPFIDAKRVAAVGFSEGARVSLLLTSPGNARAYSPKGLRFAALVDVYGRCFEPRTGLAFLRDDADLPLLALMGARDADGDPAECLPRLEAAKARGAPVEWRVFPSVAHAWDQEGFRAAETVTLFGGIHVIMYYSAEVTEESRALVFSFLAKELKRTP